MIQFPHVDKFQVFGLYKINFIVWNQSDMWYLKCYQDLEILPDCITYEPSGLISHLVLVTFMPLSLVIVYLGPGSSMFLIVPLDHSGLFEFLSGFLSYITRLPRLNGTKSLLPVWYFV